MPVPGGQLNWQQWFQALNRYIETAEVMRQGLPVDQPVDAAALQRQMAADQEHVISFLWSHPYLHEILQMMLVSAMQPGSQGSSDASASTTAQRSGESDDHSSSGRGSSSGPYGSSNGGRGSSSGGAPSTGLQQSQSSSSTVAQAAGSVRSTPTQTTETTTEDITQPSRSSGSTADAQPSPQDGEAGGDSQNSMSELSEPSQHWSGAADGHRGADIGTLILPNGLTTLAVYNISRRSTQEQLLSEWPVDGSYDFLHLRSTGSEQRRTKVVYINFRAPEVAVNFHARWQGRMLGVHGSKRPLAILAAPVQGRDANLMLTLERAPSPPVVVLGGVRVDEESSRALVRYAKAGVFVDTI